MIVEDGVVKIINLEPEGGSGVTATGAEAMLEQL
jgi:peroxiredoxin